MISEAEEEIEVTLSKPIKVISQADSDDPFNKSAVELMTMNGLSKDFSSKKNINRIVKSFTGKNGAKSKQVYPEEITGYSYFECISPPYNMEYLAKLYEISPAHHAAVDAKVESVFGLGYDFVESNEFKTTKNAARTDSGRAKLDKDIASIKNQLFNWLETINEEDSFDEIMKKVGRDYETTGNAYIEIGRDTKGSIEYIGHIPSIYMRVRRQRDGFVQIYGNMAVYFRRFGDLDTPSPISDDQNPNEVIHIKKYSPTNSYYGIPDIIAAKNALAGNEFASRYNLDYFENKAIPRYVIIVKGATLSPTSINRMVEFFETGLRGQHHRSMYVPLPKSDDKADIEFKAIESGTQDQSFGAYREANNEEIFMAHRIPASRAGVFTSDVSLAAARDADKVFKEAYSSPFQTIFENKMKPIFRTKTNALDFKLNELSLTDANTQSQIDERDVRNQIRVADEVRADRGLGPRPDGKGNDPFTPNAQQAADMKANSAQNRQRDAQRSANQPDSANNATGRNDAGQGRSTP